MAYLRGDHYIWHDKSDFHLWAKDGYDGWDNSGWATDETGENRAEGMENASGVSIPQEALDAFVMMRLAQLIYEGKVEETIDRAVDENELGGNTGSMMLKKNATKLKAALSSIALEDAEPYVWE